MCKGFLGEADSEPLHHNKKLSYPQTILRASTSSCLGATGFTRKVIMTTLIVPDNLLLGNRATYNYMYIHDIVGLLSLADPTPS